MARGRLTIGKLPHRIGPVEIERLGSLFALRCPADLDPLMCAAGGIWEPDSGRWLLTGTRVIGLVPTQDLGKLAANQTARIKILGAGEVDGRVRRVASTVEPNSQLGQVFVGISTSRRLVTMLKH